MSTETIFSLDPGESDSFRGRAEHNGFCDVGFVPVAVLSKGLIGAALEEKVGWTDPAQLDCVSDRDWNF